MQMLVHSLQPEVCPSTQKGEFVSSSEAYDPINNHNGVSQNTDSTSSGWTENLELALAYFYSNKKRNRKGGTCAS